MEFDRIYAEVDLGRIEENMEAMKEHLRPGTKMYGVVKTDAYGHGAVPVARTIDRFVCGYAVATVDEGLKLRRHGIEKEILSLVRFQPAAIRNVLKMTSVCRFLSTGEQKNYQMPLRQRERPRRSTSRWIRE